MTKEDSTFQVVYYPNLGTGIYAKAFFPNEHPRTILVGPRSLWPQNVNFLWNILCHELGHVLGIRHTKWEHDREPGHGLYYPTRALDYSSVMNADLARDLSLLVISPQDTRDVQQLYRRREGFHRYHGKTYRKYRIIDVVV